MRRMSCFTASKSRRCPVAFDSETCGRDFRESRSFFKASKSASMAGDNSAACGWDFRETRSSFTASRSVSSVGCGSLVLEAMVSLTSSRNKLTAWFSLASVATSSPPVDWRHASTSLLKLLSSVWTSRGTEVLPASLTLLVSLASWSSSSTIRSELTAPTWLVRKSMMKRSWSIILGPISFSCSTSSATRAPTPVSALTPSNSASRSSR
mmetsp:Transcript_27278/g.85987  ORF Transcript_27278/g.85987 Transcript_27278/m.85987 type:complete len:209 (-) Transcript_27278:438-1064(-)